jgi:hypothetical protein
MKAMPRVMPIPIPIAIPDEVQYSGCYTNTLDPVIKSQDDGFLASQDDVLCESQDDRFVLGG